MRAGLYKIAVVVVATAAALVFAAGAAMAVSGGGYSPDQQDCPANAESSGAPSNPGATSPGCHNVAVNVENGGTANGTANSNNTRYAEVGNDQSPHMDGNPSFGQEFNIGDPGTSTSPHSGCLAANTAGTGGGTGTGCGNNPNGAGFSAIYDYYQLYCPAVAVLPVASVDPTGGNPTGVNGPGLYQCQTGQPVGKTNVIPDTGTGTTLADLATKGLLVYVGADDNLDNGEHDGVTGAPATYTDEVINGPSDGGAVTFSVTPQNATNLPTGHNPEGAVNLSGGACADGICVGGTTQQQTVYHGCTVASAPKGNGHKGDNSADGGCASGTPRNGNVYENGSPASTQESPNCQSGSASNAGSNCFTNADGSPNPYGADGYRQRTPSNMNAQPGVQTYQDPDPQRSPVAPFGTPGLYVGTCGVYVNDGGGSQPAITGQKLGYVVPGAC